MNVLIIQSWIRLGGAEFISYHLADELRATGHEASVACVYALGDDMPRAKHNIQFHLPHPLLSEICRRHRVIFLLLAPWILLRLTWKYSKHVDVINPHNFPASWVAVIVGALRKLPVVWTCNEPPERISAEAALEVGAGDAIGWFVASSWIDRMMTKGIAEIYVPSQKTQQQVAKRYGRRASVVRIGVDSRFFSTPTSPWFLSSMGIESNLVLLVVGKLHSQKNQLICIRAMPRLLRHIPSTVLLLAGEGPWRASLEQEVKRQRLDQAVFFLGQRNIYEIRSLYMESDLNLFPAVRQSWGLTPFEALCAGTPSIVSTDTGAAETIAREQIGITCDPTTAAYGKAILWAASKPLELESMVSRGRHYVQRDLTWRKYALGATEIFLNATAGKREFRLARVASQRKSR